MQALYKQVYKKLLQAKKVFIFGHPKCGDSLGSTLAMALWLESIGKECTPVSADDVPQTLAFLPSSHRILKKLDNIHLADFDTILVLDTDFPHSGIMEKLEREISSENNFVINIDHHISNSGDGNLNVIDWQASSTAKMIYDFFKVNQIEISRPVATCLLTGIFYDTGIFSNAATDEASIESAADLLRRGVSLQTIVSDMVNNKTIKLLKKSLR
jgi:phosphoesterase RecJ-like protein